MMNINSINKILPPRVTYVLIFAGLCLYALPLAADQSKDKKPSTYSVDVENLAKNIFASCELFQEGKKLYENCDYDGAKIKFRKAVEIDPGNKKASKYLKLLGNKKPDPAPAGKTKSLKVRKKMDTLNTRKNESDIQLLETLINRVNKLETVAPPKKVTAVARDTSPHVQKQEQETQLSKKASARFTEKARLSQQTRHASERRKIESVTLKEIAESESLLKEGNKYYENLNYEKAYKLYSEALEILNAPSKSD